QETASIPKAPLPAYRSSTWPPSKNCPKELNKDPFTLSLVGRVALLFTVCKLRLAYFPAIILILVNPRFLLVIFQLLLLIPASFFPRVQQRNRAHQFLMFPQTAHNFCF